MKSKKNVIIVCITAAVLAAAVGIMAFISQKGAGSSVAAATKYLESSMRYDARGMATVASDGQRQILYNTGEIPTVNELVKALKKSYDGVASGYEGKKITFTIVDEHTTGDTGYVKLNVYVDGEKKFTRECATIKINGRWYYDGEPKE